MSEKVCITTVVDAEYMACVPLFVHCCKTVYPMHHIKIFARDSCPYRVPDAEIVPLFGDYPRYQYNTIALRFVVPPVHYRDFDYVYVTDIDMMICREDDTLEGFHGTEMLRTGLCYSNSLRHKDHYCGYRSLSGLHFASREWFERTEAERARLDDLLRRGLLGLYREYDGVMLYRMAEDSGVGLPPKLKLVNRHHGIHLGNFRLFPGAVEKWESRIPPSFRSQWGRMMHQPAFAGLVEQCTSDCSWLKEQIETLNAWIKGKPL